MAERGQRELSVGPFRQQRLRRAAILIGVLVAIGILLSTDRSGFLESFWGQHALLTNFCTGIALLAVTALVVEQIVRERELRRWHRFVVLSYRAMAQEAEDVRFKLAQYVDGRSARQAIAAQADDDFLSAIKESLESVCDLPFDAQDRRLLRLLADLGWVKTVYIGIRSIKRQNWKTLFLYAPMLMGTPATARLLNQFASLNESIIRLERLFEQLAQRSWTGYQDPTWRLEVVKQWIGVERLAVELENELHRTATGFEWISHSALDQLLAKYDLAYIGAEEASQPGEQPEGGAVPGLAPVPVIVDTSLA